MYRHVTPFLKNINTSLSSCLLRDEIINFMEYASRIPPLKAFYKRYMDDTYIRWKKT